MPTKDRKFTLKDYEQLVDDVLKTYFNEQKAPPDRVELMKALDGGEAEVPPGYHRMPDGSLMLDSEMEA